MSPQLSTADGTRQLEVVVEKNHILLPELFPGTKHSAQEAG
jgi:hypothetical protein